MDHRDHVRLIRDGVEGAGPSWADLGSGEGAFTLALADLLGPGGSIVSVDRDAGALAIQARTTRQRFPDVALATLEADFSRPLDLPPLDGIVMANSLHFSRDKLPVLRLVCGYLRPGGRLVLVEYDADRGNPWVPYPPVAPHVAGAGRRGGVPRHPPPGVRPEPVPRLDLLGGEPAVGERHASVVHGPFFGVPTPSGDAPASSTASVAARASSSVPGRPSRTAWPSTAPDRSGLRGLACGPARVPRP